MRLKLRDLDAAGQYKLKRFVGLAEPSRGNDKNEPFMLSRVETMPFSDQEWPSPGGTIKLTGRDLMEQGLPVKQPASAHVTWTVYQRMNKL